MQGGQKSKVFKRCWKVVVPLQAEDFLRKKGESQGGDLDEMPISHMNKI